MRAGVLLTLMGVTTVVGCVDDPIAPADLAQLGDLPPREDFTPGDLGGPDLVDPDLFTPDLLPPDLMPIPIDAGVTAASYQVIQSGLEGAPIIDAARSAGDTQIFALYPWGLFRTTNTGLDFTRLEALAPSGDPQFTNVVAIGSETVYVSTNDHRLFESTNSGGAFSEVSLSGGPATIYKLFGAGALYVLTDTQTLFRWRLGTWTTVTLPAGIPTQLVQAADSVVYLGTSAGLFKLTEPTTDTFSWTQVSGSLPASRFCTSGSGSGTKFAGYLTGAETFFYDGVSWKSSGNGLPLSDGESFSDFALTSTTLFAFAQRAILTVPLSGSSAWTTLLSTPASFIYRGLYNGVDLYLATTAGLFYSADNAAYLFRAKDIHSIWATKLVGHPLNAATVFVASKTGLFRSTDGGLQWTRPSTLPDNSEVTAIAVARSDESIVYTAVDRSLFTSTNGGANFGVVALPDQGVIANLVVSPTDASRVLGCMGGTLRLSTNGGATFPAVTLDVSNSSCQAALFDEENPLQAYALVGGFFVRSSDGGANFAKVIAAPLPGTDTIRKLALRPGTSSPVYLIGEKGLYQWTSTLTSLAVPASTVIKDFAMDPLNAKILYLATRDSGVLLSTDGGTSWTPSNDGLPARAIETVFVHPADRRLRFASPFASGVWRSDGAYTP